MFSKFQHSLNNDYDNNLNSNSEVENGGKTVNKLKRKIEDINNRLFKEKKDKAQKYMDEFCKKFYKKNQINTIREEFSEAEEYSYNNNLDMIEE